MAQVIFLLRSNGWIMRKKETPDPGVSSNDIMKGWLDHAFAQLRTDVVH
jgi:hypothetical protein